MTKVVYNYSASGLTNAQELDYGYYPDGLEHTVTWKNGTSTVGTWTYGYDGGGRLTSVSNPWSESTSFSYDGEDKLTEQDNANGTSTLYGYNNARGWVNAITQKHGATTLASYALTYDNGSNTVGNLTGVSENGGSSAASYGYNGLNRLTSDARSGTSSYSHTYGYDLAGNRNNKDGTSYTYSSVDKRSIDTYDGDGDITQDASNDYFYWDDLSEATYLRFGGTAYYESCSYLAGGLRGYAQQYYQNYSGAQTYFVYDGDTLLGEVANQYGNSNVVTAAYTWGPAGPVSEREVYNGASFWYHYGPQGETRQLTNAGGTVADTYTYTAYGANVATTGSDINPLRYGGEWGYYTDPQVVGTNQSIILCGHRWYDGNTGRFVSRDPLGYGAGENLYAYCENDPLDEDDSDGLQALPKPLPSEPTPPLRLLPPSEPAPIPRPIFVPGWLGPAAFLFFASEGPTASNDDQSLQDFMNATKRKKTPAPPPPPPPPPPPAPAPEGPPPDSAGCMQKEVERKQCPGSIDRVDKAGGPFEKNHVHFKPPGNNALNNDGTWKHGARPLTSAEKEWLTKHHWPLPAE